MRGEAVDEREPFEIRQVERADASKDGQAVDMRTDSDDESERFPTWRMVAGEIEETDRRAEALAKDV